MNLTNFKNARRDVPRMWRTYSKDSPSRRSSAASFAKMSRRIISILRGNDQLWGASMVLGLGWGALYGSILTLDCKQNQSVSLHVHLRSLLALDWSDDDKQLSWISLQ